jgi:hypothetical protein
MVKEEAGEEGGRGKRLYNWEGLRQEWRIFQG